jgi:hypothetical protein
LAQSELQKVFDQKGNQMTDLLLEQYGYEVAERAAILEYEAGMTREEAERVAVEEETK